MTTMQFRLMGYGAPRLACGPPSDDKKKKKKTKHDKDPMRSHLSSIGQNLAKEVWRTKVSSKTVGIDGILADKEYCIESALWLSKFGPGSITQLAEENYTNPERLQRELAARAVDVLRVSWEECHKGGNAASLQFKKVAKSIYNQAKVNLKETAIDISSVGAVRATSAFSSTSKTQVHVRESVPFSHPHLCPPVNPPATGMRPPPPVRHIEADVPDLAPETPFHVNHERRAKSPEFAVEDVEFDDDDFPDLANESQRANERSYQEAMEEMELSKKIATPTRSFPKLEPLTPQMTSRKTHLEAAALEPLTPIVSKEALAEKLGVKLNLEPIAAAPAPVKPQARPVTPVAPAGCNVTVAWLKDLAARDKIKVPEGSTFLAWPVDGVWFEKWRKSKGLEGDAFDRTKVNMLHKRLSHQTFGGAQAYKVQTVDSTVFNIEKGYILDPLTNEPHTRLVPSIDFVGKNKILVLASSYPLSN